MAQNATVAEEHGSASRIAGVQTSDGGRRRLLPSW
jgi:hypothetical protein